MTQWKTMVYGNRSRAKRRGLKEHFTASELFDLLDRTGYSCAACGVKETSGELSIDHKVPLSRGGTNTIDNIQILCLTCNQLKSDKAIAYCDGEPLIIDAPLVAVPKGRKTRSAERDRLSLSLSVGHMKKLTGLADANTGGNKSMMIRYLINVVWQQLKK